MLKDKIKRIMFGILAFIMILIPTTNSFGHSATHSWIGGYWYTNNTDQRWGQHSRKWVGNEEVFCVEPSVVIQEGEGYTEGEVSEIMNNEVKKKIELFHHYGYTLTGKTDRDYVYTQTAIWEFLGYSVKIGTSQNSDDLRDDYNSWKSDIQSQIDAVFSVPTWNGKAIKITGDYTEIDGEGKLEGIEILNDLGNKVVVEQDKIKITGKNTGKMNFRKLPKNFDSVEKVSLVYKKNGSQTVAKINFGVDPPNFSVILIPEDGGIKPTKARVRKENPQGESIPGAVFEFSYTEDFAEKWEYTTGEDGYTPYDTWNNVGAKVYIREKSVPEPYVKTDEVKSFTVGLEEMTVVFINSKKDLTEYEGGFSFVLDLEKIDSETKEEIKLNEGLLTNIPNRQSEIREKLKFEDNTAEFIEAFVFEGSFDKTFTVKDSITEFKIPLEHNRKNGEIFYGLDFDGTGGNDLGGLINHTTNNLKNNKNINLAVINNPKVYGYYYNPITNYKSNVLSWYEPTLVSIGYKTTLASNLLYGEKYWKENKKDYEPEINFDKYYIREKVAPIGYKKTNKIYSFDLKTKEHKVITLEGALKSKVDVLRMKVENEPVKNKLRLKKKAEQLVGSTEEVVNVRNKNYTIKKPKYETKFLANAKFEIKKDNNVVENVTTAEDYVDVVLTLNDVYKLIEKEAPEGYISFKDEVEIVLTDSELEEYKNLKKELDDFIEKGKKDSRYYRLIGFNQEFDYSKFVDLNKTILTDYKIRLREKYNTIGQRTDDNVIEKEIMNERKKVTIKLNKTFQEGVADEQKWAVFGLFAKEGNGVYQKDDLIEVLEFTGNEEKAFTTDYYGNYYIKELDTSEKYILNENTFDVDFKNNEKTEIKVDVTNKKKADGKIKLAKIGEVLKGYNQNDITIQGKKYTVKEPIFEKEKIGGARFKIQKDGVDFKEVTTVANNFVVLDNIDIGIYTIQEVEAPNGYVITDETKELVFLETDSKEEKIKEAVIENTREKAKLTLNKSFENGIYSKEKWAVFGLFAKEDTEFLKANDLIEVVEVTGETPIKEFKNSVPGKYYIKEIDTSSGYKINDKIIDVNLTENKEQSETVVNKLKRGSIKVVKQEKGKPEVKLDGVEFILNAKISDKEIKEIGKYVTDENGEIIIENLEEGQYELIETKTKVGYVLDSNKRILTVKGDNISMEIVENDYTKVKIIKVDENDKPLPGAKIQIKDKETDKLILEFISKETPEIIEKVLLSGKTYIVEEIEAPNGYIKAEKFEYVVKATGDLQEIKIVNRKYVETPEEKTPEIKTTARFNDDTKVNYINKETIIIDTVEFKNLIPGKEYTLEGILMDKSTNKPLLVNGKEIKSSKKFVPNKENGTADVEFKFDSSALKDSTELVVFENLIKEGKQVATHSDIKDKGQTIKFRKPEIKTTVKGDYKIKEIGNSKKYVLYFIDTVEFKNLIPGKEYILEGILMDKKTGKEFKIGDKTIEAVQRFKPDKENGTVDVHFEFELDENAENLELVVFEKLFYGRDEIANHEDIKDDNQTVNIKFVEKEIKTRKLVKTGISTGIIFNSFIFLSSLFTALIVLYVRKNANKEE